jgi:hypothetical protein
MQYNKPIVGHDWLTPYYVGTPLLTGLFVLLQIRSMWSTLREDNLVDFGWKLGAAFMFSITFNAYGISPHIFEIFST